MEPNKLETEFRKKLNSREIQPSGAAWDRLDAMLTVGEKKEETPVRKLNWLFIAAGIIGFLFIGMLFFNQNEGTVPSSESVVINEKDTTIHEIKPVQIQDQLLEATPQPENTAVVITPKQEKPSTNQIDRTIQKQPKSQSAVAINDKRPGNGPAINTNHINHNNQINQPQLTPEKANVNVDELLASASQTKNESQPKVKLKVDPSSLLSQVDGELELSFREKTINTLGKKYNDVKVALANRNKE